MPTIITADTDRDRIKNLVPAGNAEAIQTVLDDGTFKRKLYKVAEVDEASHEIVFTVTSDTLDRDSERVLPKSLEKDFGYYKENPVVLVPSRSLYPRRRENGRPRHHRQTGCHA